MSSYCVVVSYGTLSDQQFSSGHKTRESAERLKRFAVSKKYYDAKVWDEEDFRAYIRAKTRGGSRKASAN